MLTLQNSSCLRYPAGDIIVLHTIHPGNFSSGVSLDSQLDCLDPLQDSAFVCLLGSLHDVHQFFAEDTVVDTTMLSNVRIPSKNRLYLLYSV